MAPFNEKVYNMKYRIFKNINTKEKAYWLGFIFADGYVSQKGLSFHLSIKDKDQLEKFKTFIKSNKKIKSIKNRPYQIRFEVYSVALINDLKAYGCYSPKWKQIKFPKFKKYLLHSFLLGYYDGDGSEGSPLLTSGSLEFLKNIRKEFKIKNKIKKVSVNTYKLYLGSHVLKMLLNNYTNSMKRKRNFLDGVKKCECGNKIFCKSSKRCALCNNIYKTRKFNVERSKLQKMVKIMPILRIASIFNVRDNTIRKRCEYYNITIPKFPRGYWLRKGCL